MGTCVQKLSERVHLIASDNTWIEGEAIQQLHTTAKLNGMQQIVGMPDLHPGRGYPVGAAFFSTDYLYPALIGSDIGCGMSFWALSLNKQKLSQSKLEKRMGNIDTPLDASWETFIQVHFPDQTFPITSLGTIGGGNHFAELQEIDEIYDDACIIKHDVSTKCLFLLVHSGSRGLGQHILREHIDQHQHNGLASHSTATQYYLQQHQLALNFAEANRFLIAHRIMKNLNATGTPLLDIHHNLVQAVTLNDQQGWLHRKGATPSDQGMVIIPGSRGDFSYWVEPIPSQTSLFSLAHGAGRKWMRSQCKPRLSHRYTPEQLSRTHLGSRVICHDRELIYEEAPEAYKPVDSIIESLASAGLIKLIARLRPVLTYKKHGECCE